jgi:signal transduction histidine kinase
MIVSEEGRMDRRMYAESAHMEVGDIGRDEWLSTLMASRTIAACVLEVQDEPGRLDHRFIEVSPAFEQVTGLRDAAGCSMRELRPEHEHFWFDLFARIAQTGEPVNFEHPARALERRLRGHAFRIGGAHQAQVVAIFEDCARGRTEDFSVVPLDESELRLERFGATLAHELRGPIGALCNGLHILQQGAPPREDIQWALSMMERQFARLTSLVDDLLDVGRLGSSGRQMAQEPVNLHHVVSESIEACATSIDAQHHEVMIDADGSELLVRGDLRRLTQVITNLLSNSVKYTAPGGHIRIRLARGDGVATVEVRDDGLGIAADDLPHVFDYFHQGRVHENQPRGGLGVGLSIVRSIVRLHGGAVFAHSDGPGTGSTFTVQLPLMAAGK